MSAADPAPFDALVLATAAASRTTLLGLTLAERARRVVARAGARRIVVLEDAADAAELARWRDGAALLVVRADDQVVHVPLIEPLLSSSADRRVAVGADGAYAGALFACPAAADELLAAVLAAPASADRELAAQWRDAGAALIRHGEIARHPAVTVDERRGAVRMLLGLVDKPEDGPVSRYLYRPVSRPLTRLLLHTPITPNQVSILVGILGLFGCWLIAHRSHGLLIAGAALVQAAGFLDGCDGEIARLRLRTSRFGAWLDTVVDELTTTAAFLAIGWHTYLNDPAGWIVPTMVVGAACYVAGIYGLYYFLVVVSKTGNSQHYAGRLQLVEEPGRGPGLRPEPEVQSALPGWLLAIGNVFRHMVRRDFINLGSLALAILDLYTVTYLTMLFGGVLLAVIVVPDHLRLRRQLRALARRGVAPRLYAS